MKSSQFSALGAKRLRVAVLRMLNIAVLGVMCSALPVLAANPYEADTEELKLVEGLEERIGKLPTISEQLGAYRSVFSTYSTQADFPVLCALINSAHDAARRRKAEKNPLDSFNVFMHSIAFDELSVRQRTHIDFLIARYRAFDGAINDAEIGLLEVLNLPEEDIHPFTLTSAHYMAAYCSYYTNQLERSAYHARKSAEGFLVMGDDRRALEGYDGTSTTFFKLNQIDSALYYARKGLELTKNVDERYVTNLYLNYAEALMGNNQVDSAFYYANTYCNLLIDVYSFHLLPSCNEKETHERFASTG